MGKLLLRVRSSGDLYPICLQALLTIHQPADSWHGRLGHTNSRVLDSLHLNKYIVKTTKVSSTCDSCYLGKSTRLPFMKVEHCSSKPLYLIHSDLWQSPIISSHGHCYYVLFVDAFWRFSWLYPL